MEAYAVARISKIEMGPDVERYLKEIDGTLLPFEGRFIIHGGEKEIVEGSWPDDLIVVAFPDMKRARAWYQSFDYQKIAYLRIEASSSDLILIEGVGPGHKATDILSLRQIV